MKTHIILFLVVVAFTCDVWSAVSFSPGGNGICPGLRNDVLKVGQKKTYYDICTECTCYDSGASCQGIGYAAGAMHVPGCALQRLSKCCYKFVTSTGRTCIPKRCPS